MATYADLKTRIADELTRDDMGSGGEAESALVRAIATAVAQTANEEFWFSHASGTVTTTGAANSVAMPAGVRIAETVTDQYGCDLIRLPIDAMDGRIETGLPTAWAQDGDNIRLWPIPDAAYALSVYGTAEVSAPALDADDNIWTNEAADLIAARAKVILCRFPLRDADGVAAARDEERDALLSLRAETKRRRRAPLRTDLAASRRYNINTDC